MQPSNYISPYNYLNTHYILGDKIFQEGSKYFRKYWTGGPKITESKYSATYTVSREN